MVILIYLAEPHHHNSVPMLRGHRIRDFRSEKEYEARRGRVSSRSGDRFSSSGAHLLLLLAKLVEKSRSTRAYMVMKYMHLMGFVWFCKAT